MIRIFQGRAREPVKNPDQLFFFPLSEMSLCCPRKRSVTSHYSPPPPLEQLVNATSANQCRLNETNGLHLKNTHTLRTSRIFPTDVWHSDKSRRLRLNATVRNETTNQLRQFYFLWSLKMKKRADGRKHISPKNFPFFFFFDFLVRLFFFFFFSSFLLRTESKRQGGKQSCGNDLQRSRRSQMASLKRNNSDKSRRETRVRSRCQRFIGSCIFLVSTDVP